MLEKAVGDFVIALLEMGRAKDCENFSTVGIDLPGCLGSLQGLVGLFKRSEVELCLGDQGAIELGIGVQGFLIDPEGLFGSGELWGCL